MSLLATLARDAARYQKLGGIGRNLGFWMGATHRLQEYARTAHPMLRVPVQAACQAASVLWRTVWGVQISEQAKIGPGLCLIHPRDVRVGPCTIGRDCLIFHEVTIASEKAGLRIGDGVDLYVGARLLGPLTVGDDAKIGANCVVATDVAPGSDLVTARNRVVSPELVVAFGPRH